MPPISCERARARIDQSPAVIHSAQPRNADDACLDVDSHFREHGAERVERVAHALQTRLDVGHAGDLFELGPAKNDSIVFAHCRVAAQVETASARCHLLRLGATQWGRLILARQPFQHGERSSGGVKDSGTDGGRGQRSVRWRSLRERGVAKVERYPLDWQRRAVCGDLAEDGVRSVPEFVRGTSRCGRAIGVNGDSGGSLLLSRGMHSTRHAITDQVITDAPCARCGVPCIPPEALFAAGVAIAQVLV